MPRRKRSTLESILNPAGCGQQPDDSSRGRLEKQYDSPYFGRIDFYPDSLQNLDSPLIPDGPEP